MGYEILKVKSGGRPIVIDDAETLHEANRLVAHYRKKLPGLFIYAEQDFGDLRSNPPQKIPVIIESTMEEVPPWPV